MSDRSAGFAREAREQREPEVRLMWLERAKGFERTAHGSAGESRAHPRSGPEQAR